MNKVEELRGHVARHQKIIEGLRAAILEAQRSCKHEWGPWKHDPPKMHEDPPKGDLYRSCTLCETVDLVKCDSCRWSMEVTRVSSRSADVKCYSCKAAATLVLG